MSKLKMYTLEMLRLVMFRLEMSRLEIFRLEMSKVILEIGLLSYCPDKLSAPNSCYAK